MTTNPPTGPFGTEPALARSTPVHRDSARRRVRRLTVATGGASVMAAGVLTATLAPLAVGTTVAGQASTPSRTATPTRVVPQSLAAAETPTSTAPSGTPSAPVATSGGS